MVDTEELDFVDSVVYSKLNYDGRLIKSISVLLDEKWMLCINCDVSVFSKMQELSTSLLQMDNRPQSLFSNDWQEKLHSSIHGYLQTYNLSFENLSQADKEVLVKHLFELGAFQEKNAADYVAKVLGLGRATIFKYLKEWRML